MTLTLLALLFIKHYLVDFVFQTQQEIDNKGVYLDWRGAKHSLKHAVGTIIIFGFTGMSLIGVFILGMMDLILHYHIDYVKMRYGTTDVATKRFWNELGADQLAHYLTYLLLIWMTI